MRKLLSLGLILVLCGSLVGCSKLSEEKIEQCKEYEELLDVTTQDVDETYNDIGDYDNIMYCAYNSSIVSSRVLEDDYITVMGVSTDLLTYTSTMGGEITIPSMLVEKIDM